MTNYSKLTTDGLWHNNPGLVQLLGLCPLLAVTGTAVNGLGLGLATLFVLAGSNLTVSLLRGALKPEIRIPVFVLVIAALVTTVELVMNAYFHELFRTLGIFIPLIVTNCAIIARAEAFASRNAPLPALFDGLMMGTGFAAVLVVLGALREVVGHGSLFGVDIPDYDGFLLAVLPPGAFIGLALLIAAHNGINARFRARAARAPAAAPAPAGA